MPGLGWVAPARPANAWQQAPLNIPVVTPVRADALLALCRNHPNQALVMAVCGPQGVLRVGCHTGYTGPLYSYSNDNLVSAEKMPKVIEKWALQEYAAGRYLDIDELGLDDGGLCFQALGVVDKKGFQMLPDGTVAKKYRTITHLSLAPAEGGISVNDGIDPDDYSLEYMTILDTARAACAMGVDCCACALDLANAFRILPRAAEVARMHCLLIPMSDGTTRRFCDAAMDFGGRSTPFWFDALIKLVVYALQQRLDATLGPVCVLKYLLDDVTILCPDQATGQRAFKIAVDLYQELGLPIQPSKSVCAQQRFESLGYALDLRNKTIKLPDDKRAVYCSELDRIKNGKHARCAPLRAMAGRMGFAHLAVPGARAFVSSLFTVQKILGDNDKRRVLVADLLPRRGCTLVEDLTVLKLFLEHAVPRPMQAALRDKPSTCIPWPNAPFPAAPGEVSVVGDASGIDGFGFYTEEFYSFRRWDDYDVLLGNHTPEERAAADTGCRKHKGNFQPSCKHCVSSTLFESLCMAMAVVTLMRDGHRGRPQQRLVVRYFTDNSGVVACCNKGGRSSVKAINCVWRILALPLQLACIDLICVWQPREYPTQVLADKLSHCVVDTQVRALLSKHTPATSGYRTPASLPHQLDDRWSRQYGTTSPHRSTTAPPTPTRPVGNATAPTPYSMDSTTTTATSTSPTSRT